MRMNTKLVLGIVVAGVVIGGGYLVVRGSSAPAGEQTAHSADAVSSGGASQEEAGAFQGSIFDLSARGGDWKCTVGAQASTGGGQAISSGAVYVSGKKVRADFTSEVQGHGTVASHLIADGTDVYAWSSMDAQGIKTAQAASDTSEEPLGADQNYSYDCVPAQAPASLFVAPSDITFRNL